MDVDELRLGALRQGASHAGDVTFVTIQVRDLRWLLDLVDSLRRPPAPCDVLSAIDTPATNFEMN